MDAIEVRLSCINLAQQYPNAPVLKIEDMIKLAKEYEKYAWGGMAPIEKPPTPLSTIEEAANDVKSRIVELYGYTADEHRATMIAIALSSWERFMADLDQALGDMRL